MSAFIGDSYFLSIGRNYERPLHALEMLRPDKSKSFFDRVLDAAHEKLGGKVTQVRIANLIGVKQPSVYEWRTGAPKIENGVEIANKLDVCVQWLYTGDGPRHPWDTIAPEDPRLRELLALWNQLEDPERKALLGVARHLKQEAEESQPDGAAFKESKNKKGRSHAERPPQPPGVDKSRRKRAA
jgi:hypothetical protein